MGLLAASQMNSDSNSRCDAFVVYAARVLYSHSPLKLSYSPLSLFLAVSRALLSQPFVCSLSLSFSQWLLSCRLDNASAATSASTSAALALAASLAMLLWCRAALASEPVKQKQASASALAVTETET